jgi:hypothetical protein
MVAERFGKARTIDHPGLDPGTPTASSTPGPEAVRAAALRLRRWHRHSLAEQRRQIYLLVFDTCTYRYQRPGPARPDTCTYRYAYGYGTATVGVYATERFTFTSSSVHMENMNWGSGLQVRIHERRQPEQRVRHRGLRPGPAVAGVPALLRLPPAVQQLEEEHPPGLLFGSLTGDAAMLRSPQNPTFYYVRLTGLTVGVRRLRIPESAFALQPDGSGGVIVDSGTALTLFPGAVISEGVWAFRRS